MTAFRYLEDAVVISVGANNLLDTWRARGWREQEEEIEGEAKLVAETMEYYVEMVKRHGKEIVVMGPGFMMRVDPEGMETVDGSL